MIAAARITARYWIAISLPRWIAVCLVVLTAVLTKMPASANDDADFFERKIRPVLIEHCYECHSESADVVQAGLRLDTPDAMLSGGDSGAALLPGDPDGSLLIRALRYEDSEMPPSGRLDERIVSDFESWVRRGAIDPRPHAPSVNKATEPTIDWDRAREFWSFQRPTFELPKSVPSSRAKGWIDRFVNEKLLAVGIAPSPLADRNTLLRRLCFDLTGLPPTSDQAQEFLGDDRPDAIERLVDRLLASPENGEHWTRTWLDVARYAEDQAHKVGNNDALTYPNAYLYRDWVVNALAADTPYDEFIRLQLAADHFLPDDKSSHIALGFIGLGPKYYRRGAPEVMADEWEDRVDTVSRGLLGLTVACARCHDHKYDPIPTSDYYALAGVFASTKMLNRPLNDSVEVKNGEAAKPQDAVHIVRDGDARDLNVMLRGDVNRKGDVAPRGFLTVLSSDRPKEFKTGSGRADLADAIVDPQNPLTARVIVNRVWRQMMGRGLVESPSNFGMLGERPTHPELLDALAVRFVENGWSLKWLQREIVLSETYQRGGNADEHAIHTDPANQWLGRRSPKRLSIEAYRDAVLWAAGRLDTQVGGRSIEPQDPGETRRTLYSEISRMDLNPLLARFDFPDPNAHSAKRVETTTPLQKLFLMNSPFMIQQAQSLSELTQNSTRDPGGRINWIYQRLFARSPTMNERQLGIEFVATDQPDQWTQYALVLLISNEMMFID
ncbi:PSD1 and planctomycete cytochrome C domain-containing protein [Stieleria varia]|uniref:Planctomycete cytochrome C n=1 Tax=Stieleria varia TaxID=2528005 RepID=A0A5C6ATE3_9BACT|nr:PSD1 and planctomycete cytochrome C domain-containing protein [Stieleria varia]TWU02336.1 Planctomycete cytochrome C [Stieleria varia]